jgi:DNA-binding transcriptional LysR family regulator
MGNNGVEKLEAMRAFVNVVASNGYAEAARRLGVTRSAVSKAVTELERQLGVRLLDRTTRRVSVTEPGSIYYERCVAILSQVEESEAEIARLHEEPRGLLRINGPMSFGTLYLGDAVSDFMGAYPDLRIELDLTDRFIDPLAEGVDVTIRIGALLDSSLIARKIAETTLALVASPSYLAERGVPKRPEDLIAHSGLDYGRQQPSPRWKLARSGGVASVPIDARLFSNNGEVLRSAAVRGRGLALLPAFLVEDDVRAGRLVSVMDDAVPPAVGIWALYAPNRFVPAKIRLFIDFLVARFGAPRPDDA